MRIGMGYDVHRLTEDRKLIIGGVEIPYEKGLLGHSDADVLLHAIMDALHAQAETAFQAPPPKKPGLDELIAYLEAQHIPMAVASSSRMASILRHLNNWHMTDHFKALISGEQFSTSKPDPEIFLTAAKALGTVPAETLVLEDSYNGVRAGARGGFITVMVPDLVPADDEMRSLYTMECASLDEVLEKLKNDQL